MDGSTAGVKSMSNEILKGLFKGAVQTAFFPAANVWDIAEYVVPSLKDNSSDSSEDSGSVDQYINYERKTFETVTKRNKSDGEPQTWNVFHGVQLHASMTGMAQSSFLGLSTGDIQDMFVKNLKGTAVAVNPIGAITVFSLLNSSEDSSEESEVGSSEDSTFPSLTFNSSPNEKVVTDETIEIDGKKYEVKVFENGELRINGKCWHLHGNGADITVQKFQYNREKEEIEIQAEGKVPLLDPRKVHKFFSKEQMKQILPHLLSSNSPKDVVTIDTPVGGYTITLQPGSASA